MIKLLFRGKGSCDSAIAVTVVVVVILSTLLLRRKRVRNTVPKVKIQNPKLPSSRAVCNTLCIIMKNHIINEAFLRKGPVVSTQGKVATEIVENVPILQNKQSVSSGKVDLLHVVSRG